MAANGIEDNIMRKNTTTAKLTEYEIKRNRKISKVRYIVEQYFGLTHLHDNAYRARFTDILKNLWDSMCRTAPRRIKKVKGAIMITNKCYGGEIIEVIKIRNYSTG